MILAINYSNSQFTRKQKLNSWTAKHIGKVDKVRSFTQADIDGEFYEENKDTFSYQRGAGYWIWKPYIILKALKEVEYGDYVLYVDSGLSYLKGVTHLIDKLKASEQDVMVFDIPLLEVQWTKRELFDYFQCYDQETLYSRQIISGVILVKKSPDTILFIEEWLTLCKKNNLLFPNPSNNEYPRFIEHREDQSILSLLSKSKGIKPFSDPTEYMKFPIEYIEEKRLCLFSNPGFPYYISSPYFLAIRRNSAIKYIIKYCVKSILCAFGLTKSRVL